MRTLRTLNALETTKRPPSAVVVGVVSSFLVRPQVKGPVLRKQEEHAGPWCSSCLS